MKATRQTQPHRAGPRGLQPVLDKMLAGRATPAPGAGKALYGAIKAGPAKRAKLLIPRK